MDIETTTLDFYVIACYGKKDLPYKGDVEGRFIGYWYRVGYWGAPIVFDALKRIAEAMRFETKEEAEKECEELNKDKRRWYYCEVRKFSARLTVPTVPSSDLNVHTRMF